VATKELAVASQQRATSHFLLLKGIFFTKNNMTIIPHPPYFSLFRRLGHHFDTTVVIEAESQVLVNSLTEHDFQDAFKKLQKRRQRCIHAEEDYFEGDGGQ
jgi:hypothetical protein